MSLVKIKRLFSFFMSFKNKVIVGNFGFLILFLVDRLFKWMAKNYLASGDSFLISPLGLLIKFFANPAGALGLAINQKVLYFLISLILLILFHFLIRQYRQKNFYYLLSLSLIVVGAISNLIDRLQFGYVIDLFQLWFWPVFNLADLMIIAGTVMIIIKNLSFASLNNKKED